MPVNKDIVYRTEHNYQMAINRVERSDVTDANKKHIYDFFDYLKAGNRSKIRQCFYIEKLRNIGSMHTKDFKQWDRTDMIKVLGA